MSRRFHRQDNGHGEWSILDIVLGYRICSHHRHPHGGVHVHGPPPDLETLPLPDLSMVRADALMRRYGRKHDHFDGHKLQKEVRLWRSR